MNDHLLNNLMLANKLFCNSWKRLSILSNVQVWYVKHFFTPSLTLPIPCISESRREIKINLNFYFPTSLWYPKRFHEGFKGTTKAPQRHLQRHHKEMWKSFFSSSSGIGMGRVSIGHLHLRLTTLLEQNYDSPKKKYKMWRFFSCFLNCSNGTKLRNAPQIFSFNHIVSAITSY